MLNAEQIISQKTRIIMLLREDGREGMEGMIAYLENSDFFATPASTKYHGCYPGGLAKHSLGVNTALWDLTYVAGLQPAVDAESEELSCFASKIDVPTLLHDVCKIGVYQTVKNSKSKQKYSWVYGSPSGHALLSLKRILEHIELSEEEYAMIQFHMGIYGSKECTYDKGEFVMRPDGMFKAYNCYPLVKFMYFADETAAAQERAEEGS